MPFDSATPPASPAPFDKVYDSSGAVEAASSPMPAERERTFACTFPDCAGRFHRKFTLREHIKTHTGEKPYQCPIKTCAKRFTTSGNLSRHRRLHMAKRICCPVHDCTRIFTKQEKLLRHLKVHMGSAAHACSFPGCPKTFSTSGNLSRHLRTQHRECVVVPPHAPVSCLPPPHVAFISSPTDTAWQALQPLPQPQPHFQFHHQSALSAAEYPDTVSDNEIADLLECLFHGGANEDPRASFANPSSTFGPGFAAASYHHHHHHIADDGLRGSFAVYY